MPKTNCRSLVAKYAGSTVDPLQLIRKYQKAKKRGSSTVRPRYQAPPTRPAVQQYTQYTTSDTFRSAIQPTNQLYVTDDCRNTTQPSTESSTAPQQKEEAAGLANFGSKLFSADRITVRPVLSRTALEEKEEKPSSAPSKYRHR